MADDFIVSDVEILGGKPCVRGTRLSVEFLLELAASGATQADILAQYPQTALVELATVITVARVVASTWIVHLASPSKKSSKYAPKLP